MFSNVALCANAPQVCTKNHFTHRAMDTMCEMHHKTFHCLCYKQKKTYASCLFLSFRDNPWMINISPDTNLETYAREKEAKSTIDDGINNSYLKTIPSLISFPA